MFASPYLGKIDEEFIIKVDSTPEPLRLHITGAVIGPTFQVSVNEIDFGRIAYGFVSSRVISVVNSSSVRHFIGIYHNSQSVDLDGVQSACARRRFSTPRV